VCATATCNSIRFCQRWNVSLKSHHRHFGPENLMSLGTAICPVGQESDACAYTLTQGVEVSLHHKKFPWSDGIDEILTIPDAPRALQNQILAPACVQQWNASGDPEFEMGHPLGWSGVGRRDADNVISNSKRVRLFQRRCNHGSA